MSQLRIFVICVIALLSLAGSAGAATPFSVLPTFDCYIGNDPQMGPTGADTNGEGMHARNQATRRRVSYVTYDISTTRGPGQVFLNVSFSNYGYDVGRVDVYGVLEPSEHLVAAGINWNNAPGVKNNPTPPVDSEVALDPADLTGVLVTFDAPARGTRASTETSQALADFLNSDTDGFVAFLFAPNGASKAILRTVNYTNGGTKLEGEVGGTPVQALNPDPADKATDVWRDAVLGWKPGTAAAAHNVYFGTSLESVTAADGANSPGVLVSLNQDANSYDPPGHLEFDKTYYWRVDEVNAPPDSTVHKGAVWSFTVEPFAREVGNVTATASSSEATSGPENTVNSSGLENGLHSTLDKAMWLSAKSGPQPTWIQFQFDRTYKLHEMWVWNYNISVESIVGLGLKTVTVEYSVNGTDWASLGDVEFTQGPSSDGYAHNTTVDFQGVGAKYVRLTPKSNWGGTVTQYGLSEVRFLYIPAHATRPEPASGSTGVSPDVVLSWRPGREAAVHKVYFGTDGQAVADGTAPVVSRTEANYAPPALEFGTTYSWKVVEVNEATSPSSWESDLWSFSTQEFSIADDFEGYTNESPNRVFQTWTDGYGFSPDEFFPKGNPGNGSGAMIGYDPTAGDIMEKTVIHGGTQSMPVEYNNVESPFYSEVDRTWQTPQDWTVYSADTLQVCVRGNAIRFIEPSPGSVTMSGAGADIYGTADQFSYVYKSLEGNGLMIVRVDSIENTEPWAKAGVMIRQGLGADSQFAAVYATPGQGVRYQARLLAAGEATSDTSVATPEQITLRAPVWIKLERSGSACNAFYSTDGAKWTAMSWNPQTLNLMGTVTIGLAVTSHVAGVAATAEFSGISTSGGVSGSWRFTQIGIDQPLNSRDDLYVVLQDSAGHFAVVTHDDRNAVLQDTWREWRIPLSKFGAGVNVAAVKKITIGVGNRQKPTPGAAGMLFIDDIGFGRPAAAVSQP
jgi:hypothetical protein